MSVFLVDTDVFSYIFKQHPTAAAFVDLLQGSQLTVSFMTLAEARFGARRRNWGRKQIDELEKYADRYTVLYPNNDLCSIWADIRADGVRKGRPLDGADAWIAATAVHYDFPLATNNQRHFASVAGLRLIRF